MAGRAPGRGPAPAALCPRRRGAARGGSRGRPAGGGTGGWGRGGSGAAARPGARAGSALPAPRRALCGGRGARGRHASERGPPARAFVRVISIKLRDPRHKGRRAGGRGGRRSPGHPPGGPGQAAGQERRRGGGRGAASARPPEWDRRAARRGGAGGPRRISIQLRPRGHAPPPPPRRGCEPRLPYTDGAANRQLPSPTGLRTEIPPSLPGLRAEIPLRTEIPITAKAAHRDPPARRGDCTSRPPSLPRPRCRLSLTCRREQSVGIGRGVHGQLGAVVAQVAQDGFPKRWPAGFQPRLLPGHLQDRAVRQTDGTRGTLRRHGAWQRGPKTCRG